MYEELREVWAELTAPGAPFEVTEVEVRGVTLKAYAGAPPSLREVWLGSAAHADRDYLVYGDERWTYAEAHRQVASVGAWLAGHGVRAGDRVAIAMRNYPEWLLAYWAAVSTGVSVVGMNAWWIGPEMVYALQDSTPRVLICDDERLARVLEHRHDIPDTTIVAVRSDDRPAGVVAWADLVGGAGPLPEVSVDPDADACIFYTSGTTGRPKGAQLTHRGCVNNLMSLGFANTLVAIAGQRARRAAPAPPQPAPGLQPCGLLTTPLFHVTANNCVAHAMTAAGGKLVCMYKWDAGEALHLIEQERVTTLTGVPVMSRELISHPDFAKRDTSSLQSVGGGGAQVQPDLVAKIEQTVDTARPSTGYGMTETCGIITALAADYFVDKPDSAGPAMPVFDAKCVDADGREVPRGELGELWVRGAQVIRGYLNQPEATAEAITDGWLHTGDVARIDDEGFIFVVDRVKDMVLRGGENVYCAEVEAAIFEHPAVSECVVFGVADDRLGEEVAAAVVVAAGIELSADELRVHLGERISRHKIPRYLWLRREPLPRNASGKFVKRELREALDLAEAQ